jgi:hypothetical protein
MASKIDRALARELTQEDKKQNSAAGGSGLKTPGGQYLNGFFIDRQCLESILQNTNVAGVSINFANHPKFTGSADNIVTLIIAGAEPSTTGPAGSYQSTGDLYSDPPPCPTMCNNI